MNIEVNDLLGSFICVSRIHAPSRTTIRVAPDPVPIPGNVPTVHLSSAFLRRMIGSMFMRVNSKCAHQLRPPPSEYGERGRLSKPLAAKQDRSKNRPTAVQTAGGLAIG